MAVDVVYRRGRIKKKTAVKYVFFTLLSYIIEDKKRHKKKPMEDPTPKTTHLSTPIDDLLSDLSMTPS